METQSSKSQNMREFRRLRAVELFESGMKQVDIARVLGVTKGAVKAKKAVSLTPSDSAGM